MKKSKIVVSALALLIGTGLAGSISGTIAWYQYSTRAAGAYVGMSGGTSGNLQMRIRKEGQAANAGWTSRLIKEDIAAYLGEKEILPVTSGDMEKDDALPEDLYANPLPGKASYDKWEKADEKNYISLPLELRFVERNSGEEEYVEKDVYLSDLLIQEDRNNQGEDLSEAIRFHISSYSSAAPSNRINRLISLNGGSIDTNGALDLDAEPGNDKAYSGDKYGFDGGTYDEIIYGEGEQEAYAPDEILVTTSADSLNLTNTSGRSIGKTVAGDSALLNIEITIWVEGWQQFDNAAIWDVDYINSQFDVGFEFAVDIE